MVKHRVERVSDRIQEEVSDLLLKQIRDPRIEFVTVTGVKVSPDLELATIYVSALGDSEARQTALKALRALPATFAASWLPGWACAPLRRCALCWTSPG